ncbi:YeeE/YedE family protein [Haloarcula nitratireducens]|uniref:YeeE/YedE family protein n=1 Tax=Haloarcula nitratireducens TaxID=2487749 RepID=A0AAW4PK98_9EURY|nr:YeeE/YedE family protein [Halomicroarcula nitratireducens]MBX0297790.1 YeeE/YedE family protein [Halomicroarcula nitratireducens]
MVPTLLVAAVVGLGLGAFLQKGRFCFVNAFRDFFAYKDYRVTKGVIAATLLTMVFWGIAYQLGYYQGFWTPGWGLTGLFGGFIFGVGMTYAGGCASGTLYRAGEGYLQFWLTLLFMGVGYAVFTAAFPTLQSAYFQPLTFGEGLSLFTISPIPAGLLAVGVAVLALLVYATLIGRQTNTAKAEERSTVASVQLTTLLAPVVGLRQFASGTAAYFRSLVQAWRNPIAASKQPWDPRTAALGITAMAVLWFTQVSIVGITGPEARWTGYLLSQAGVDAGSFEYWGSILFQGQGVGVTVDMVMIGFVIVGAAIAALWSGDFSLRVPKRRRLPNAVAGGFLMGAGSRLAPGCNIGNIYSGIAELSVHSFIATIGIVAGVYVMTHWIYRDVGCAI